MVMADVCERGHVEVACMHALLDESVRRRLDDRARSSGFDHAREPCLHFGGFSRRLPADVVDLAATDLECDRAHRAGNDPAGLQHVLSHVRDGGLAVGSGDAGKLQMS